ncbi:MAG: hypothetical protein JSW59_11750, partial [Phycisphaerales bacterium]
MRNSAANATLIMPTREAIACTNAKEWLFRFILVLNKNILPVIISAYDAISTASHYGSCISKQDTILPDIPV